MVKVLVKKQVDCPLPATVIRTELANFFTGVGVGGDVEVSVAIVGVKEMYGLAKKYLNEVGVLHNVLSFPYKEGGNFVFPPNKTTHLGDIVICYPKVIEQSKEEGVAAKDKILELIKHGALHLTGVHHK